MLPGSRHHVTLAALVTLVLAGCLAAAPPADPGSDAGPASTDGDDPEDPGRAHLAVEVQPHRDALVPGDTVQVEVAVENVGQRTVWFNDACGQDWTVTVHGSDGDRVPSAPRASCLVLAWTPLEPGETHAYSFRDRAAFTWNGTAWNASGADDGRFGNGTYDPVDPGVYTVEAAFAYHVGPPGDRSDDAFPPPSAVELQEVTGDAPVRVRDASQDGDGGDRVSVAAEADRAEIAPGERVHVNVTARNDGNRTVEHRVGCSHTWAIEVLRDGADPVQHRRPAARCLGFSWERLAPGEVLPYPGPEEAHPFTWNGTVWNGSAYVDADPGNYTIRASLPYRPADGGETRNASGAVTVRVAD